MARIMYDAVTARNILNHNRSPALVAGYIDKIKLEPWSGADWALFPDARHVTIVKKASTRGGHVLDVEPGDATPDQAPGWAAQRRRDGFAHPTIYCNRSTWPLVRTAFDRQGVAPPLYWIATATGRAEIPAGAIAAQYLLDYRGVDVSVVADYWPGVDPETEDDMQLSDKVKLFGGEEVTMNNVLAGIFARVAEPLGSKVAGSTYTAEPKEFWRNADYYGYENRKRLDALTEAIGETNAKLDALVTALTPKPDQP